MDVPVDPLFAPEEPVRRSQALPPFGVGMGSPPKLHVVAMEPRPTGLLRRSVDVLGALLLLAILAPAFALIALAVKATSPGPVIYWQTRVGINRRAGRDRRASSRVPAVSDRRLVERRAVTSAGRLYHILKFRTMVDGAETKRGPVWASKNDDRITAVGRLLRRTRLDELPQLVNVLRGEMSFIGPRPERPFFVDRFCTSIPGYRGRLTVVPGITGLAQVEHTYDTSHEDVCRKLEYDLRYLRERNVGVDLRILWKTVRVVLSGHGAH
jgi:lipopolysaccharide/colanic/teichoic acid biosynthesis glycosyltransferase